MAFAEFGGSLKWVLVEIKGILVGKSAGELWSSKLYWVVCDFGFLPPLMVLCCLTRLLQKSKQQKV